MTSYQAENIGLVLIAAAAIAAMVKIARTPKPRPHGRLYGHVRLPLP